MTIQGNPSMNSGGNPAVVRIYQLANNTNFQGMDIDELLGDDEQALGAELIHKQQRRLYPDQAETLEFELDKKARYIGIAADLRQPEPDQWRVSYPIDAVKGRKVVVRVESDRLLVEVEK